MVPNIKMNNIYIYYAYNILYIQKRKKLACDFKIVIDRKV